MLFRSIAPVAGDSTVSLLGRAFSAAYPAGNLLVLAMLARIAIGNSNRCRSMWLLIAGLGFMLAADVVYLLGQLSGSRPAGGLDEVGYALCFVCMTAVALCGSMVRTPRRGRRSRCRRARACRRPAPAARGWRRTWPGSCPGAGGCGHRTPWSFPPRSRQR